jgi:hypothetical protein
MKNGRHRQLPSPTRHRVRTHPIVSPAADADIIDEFPDPSAASGGSAHPGAASDGAPAAAAAAPRAAARAPAAAVQLQAPRFGAGRRTDQRGRPPPPLPLPPAGAAAAAARAPAHSAPPPPPPCLSRRAPCAAAAAPAGDERTLPMPAANGPGVGPAGAAEPSSDEPDLSALVGDLEAPPPRDAPPRAAGWPRGGGGGGGGGRAAAGRSKGGGGGGLLGVEEEMTLAFRGLDGFVPVGYDRPGPAARAAARVAHPKAGLQAKERQIMFGLAGA